MPKYKTIKPPRGMHDQFEEDLLKIESVISIASEIARSYGFKRIETPTIESIEVFTNTGDKTIDKCFTFMDKSNREMILRPDINAPISRAIVNHSSSQPLPQKIFFHGSVFRYRKSYRREFIMFGVETYGIAEPIADAEILRVVVDLIKRLGFKKYTIEYSNLSIFSRLIKFLSKTDKVNVNVEELIYKLRFHNKKEQKSILNKIGFQKKSEELIMDFLSCPEVNKNSFNLLKKVAAMDKSIEIEALSVLNFRDELLKQQLSNCIFKISNLHGESFYSGLTYRLYLSTEMGDGGRYDNFTLLLGGLYIPATGLGFGISRLIRLAEAESILIPIKTNIKYLVRIVRGSEETVRPYLRLLRKQNIIVNEIPEDYKDDRLMPFAIKGGYHRIFVIKSFNKISGLYEVWSINIVDGTNKKFSTYGLKDIFNCS